VVGIILEEFKLRTERPHIDGESGVFIPERSIKLATLGLWLVIVGITGEGLFEMATSWTDGMLQDFGNTMLEITTEQAGSAAKSAKTAKLAADRATASADEANTVAGKALDKSKEATDAAGKAQEKVETVGKRAEEINVGLRNLALCNAPRVISPWSVSNGGFPQSPTKSYVDPLRPMAKQKFFIEVVPDAEARRAALHIQRALVDANWDMLRPPRFVDGLADGVSVQPYVNPRNSPPNRPNLSVEWSASGAAYKLVDFLHTYNWRAEFGFPTDSQGKLIHDETVLPAGAIRIQVGLYPPAVFINPPGEKEWTSALEESTRQQEKARAEYMRGVEKTMAPELIKKYEEQEARMKAEFKRMTSNGPCQDFPEPPTK